MVTKRGGRQKELVLQLRNQIEWLKEENERKNNSIYYLLKRIGDLQKRSLNND